MAVKISTPNDAYHSQDIVLGDVGYTLLFKFNTSDNSWYISLNLISGETLLEGIKVMPNQNLTGRNKYSKPLAGGDIWCVRIREDHSPINYDNFGIDESYELWWMTDAEAIEAGIYDRVQL